MFSAVIIYCKSILQFISCLVQAMEWKGTIMTWKAIRIIRGTRGKKLRVQLAFCYLINFFFTFWSAELNRKSPVGSCKWVKLPGLNFEFWLIFNELRGCVCICSADSKPLYSDVSRRDDFHTCFAVCLRFQILTSLLLFKTSLNNELSLKKFFNSTESLIIPKKKNINKITSFFLKAKKSFLYRRLQIFKVE